MFKTSGLNAIIIIVFLSMLLLIYIVPYRTQYKYTLIFGAGSSLLGGLIATKLEPLFTKTIQI